MKASSTLVVDKDGKAVHAAGLYTAPRHPLALMAVNLEGAATVFELAPTEALEIGRHLFEAAGMTPRRIGGSRPHGAPSMRGLATRR